MRLTLMFKALSRGEVSHVLDICRLVQLVSSNACYFYCLFNRPYSRYPPSLPALKDLMGENQCHVVSQQKIASGRNRG